MTKKTITNIIISTLIVFLFFFVGHINVKDIDHSETGYFLIFTVAYIYCIPASIVTTIIVIRKKKYWNSIVFITSCLTNIVITYIPIVSIINDSSEHINISALILFVIPPIIFIYQIVLFTRNNKIDRLSRLKA